MAMLRIWRWPLKLDGFTEIEMPVGARVLTVEPHSQGPSLFAVVDPGQGLVSRTFVLVGTGHEIDTEMGEHVYLGTIQGSIVTELGARGFVTHAFEVVRTPKREEDTDGTQG